ncbi:MAG: transporter [Betaproteobacteria bacterium]
MRTVITGCIVFILMLAPASAWAVHPFVVEDTNTQGKGNFLFELNGDYTKDNMFKTTNLTGVFRAGMSKNTDLSLEVPYLMLDPSPVTDQYERGYGDVLLKMKWRIYENEVNQSAGFQFYTGMPTGNVDKGLGTNNVLIGFQLMDQQECRNNVLHVSLSYESFVKHFAEDYAIRFGLALERKITGSFRVLAEVAGEIRKEAEGDHTARPFTFMTGVKYDISKSWYVDLAARAGLNKDAEDYTALAGIAWKF